MSLEDSLDGVAPPLVTPFDDGAVDEEALAAVVDHALAGGVDALVPCGTTGEFASLDPTERRRVVEATVDAAAGEVPVIAGASATSVAETVAAVEDAAAVGADAALVLPPYYHTGREPGGNERFFEAVLERTTLPIVLYNIPVYTGEPIAVETVSALADRDRVLGIKDSSGDMAYLLSLLRETPAAFRCLQGYDALLVPALRMGVHGGINALANVFPAVYAELLEVAASPRGARLGTEAVVPLFEACSEYGFAPATKAALTHLGVIPDDGVRPPLSRVPPAGRERIGEAVDRALEI